MIHQYERICMQAKRVLKKLCKVIRNASFHSLLKYSLKVGWCSGFLVYGRAKGYRNSHNDQYEYQLHENAEYN